MIHLSNGSHRLRMQAAIATTLHVHASWENVTRRETVPGATNRIISTTDLTDVLSGVPNGVVRRLQSMVVRNVGAAATFVALSHFDGAAAVEIARAFVAPGGQLDYVASSGFALRNLELLGGVHGGGALAAGDYVSLALNGTALTTIQAAAGRIDFMPFIPVRTMSVDSLALEVTTGVASSLFRLAVYGTASGEPGDLIAGTGDLSAAAPGYIGEAIAPTTLVAGVPYWLAVHSSSNQTYRGVAIAAAYPVSVPASSTTTQFTLKRATASFAGGLPATAPPAANTGANLPAIRLRLA